MHLVGLVSSYFAHDARSQEPKTQKYGTQLRATISRHRTGVLADNVYRDNDDAVHSISHVTSSRLTLFETTYTSYPIQHKFTAVNMSVADPSGRPIKRLGSATTCFLGLWVRIPPGHGCLSLMSVFVVR